MRIAPCTGSWVGGTLRLGGVDRRGGKVGGKIKEGREGREGRKNIIIIIIIMDSIMMNQCPRSFFIHPHSHARRLALDACLGGEALSPVVTGRGEGMGL